MVVQSEKEFLSGVVEGFYGRPWTCSQRRELFSRMNKSSMNTYIYAPKDDIKHRALWRQLYTAEEEGKLKVLIDSANDQGIRFVYAISPGLDITFSSSTDVTALKRKMKQVGKLGCRAFALLFDDIDPRLKPSDAVVYQSSAHAQAGLANEVHSYLKKPQFLFCPTEYCKTRALPSVAKSQYLTTLGQELNPEIDIMWTGNKVIPEIITKESIEELGYILKRKPVIWDNIHANDYDQRRVFLGAYCGRPLELFPLLNGILTNPNCEFEANFVPIHTLGTWCTVAKSVYGSLRSDQECSGNSHLAFDDVGMDELSDDDASPEGPDCHMPLVELEPLTAADVTQVVSEYDPKHALRLAVLDWLKEFSIFKKAPVKSYSKRNLKTTLINGQTVLTATPYELDIAGPPLETLQSMRNDKQCVMDLTESSLFLLTDLFCLPYGHGEKGVQLLEEFTWLLVHVRDICELPPSKEKVSTWYDCLLKCEAHCQEVYDLFALFCKIPNEAIVYDLYPYIWDLKEVVLCLDTYVHWLSNSAHTTVCLDNLLVTEGCQVPVGVIPSDFIEPWHIMYLGGLTMALHRLMPCKGSYLFLDQAPDCPSNDLVQIRSYSSADKEALYHFCAFEETEELIDIDKIDLPGDREIGAYLNICPKTLFTIEDSTGVCGYVAAVPNNQYFHDEFTGSWLPKMSSKYVDGDYFSNSLSSVDGWRTPTSAHIAVRLTRRVRNARVIKRTLLSALSVLKAAGSTSVYCQLPRLECDDSLELYKRLGFFPVEGCSQGLLWRGV